MMLKTYRNKLVVLGSLMLPLVAVAQSNPVARECRPGAGACLENPALNSIKSGVGLISGWDCTAQEVEIRIDGRSVGVADVGSPRQDVIRAGECTHNNPNVGYGILFNYNLLESGSHTAQVFFDRKLISEWNFSSVRSGGEEFLTGAAKTTEVDGFPGPGLTAVLAWEEESQNFVVTDVRSTEAVDGSPNRPWRMRLDQRNDLNQLGIRNNFKVDLQKGERLRIDLAVFDPELADELASLCQGMPGVPMNPLGGPIQVYSPDFVGPLNFCGQSFTYRADMSGEHMFSFDLGRNAGGSYFFPTRF